MDRSDVKRQIRSMLLKSLDKKGTTEAERSVCRRVADKLMAKHDISEVEIWGSTKIEDIPEEIQDDFINSMMGHADKIVSMLEREQDKVLGKIIDKAEGYVKENKKSMVDKFDTWLDSLFK